MTFQMFLTFECLCYSQAKLYSKEILSMISFAFATLTDMVRGNSILLTFGKPGKTLERKIAITGFICRLVLFIIFNPIFLMRARFFPNAWNNRKNTAIRVAKLFFPFHSKGNRAIPSTHGRVFIINHPTLNDPICTILYALDLFPDCEIIVPVNLPWFESICSYRLKLRNIGINIVPILTPETAKKLTPSDDVSKVQTALMKNYVAEFTRTLSLGGIAVVAQHATRQRYIFANPAQSETGIDILPTISLILDGIRRAKLLEQVLFIPVGVVPYHKNAKPKLNPFCKYTLVAGEPILATELFTKKNAAKRPADLYMLLRLMELLPVEYHFECQL